jgi:hypothetical protein
MPKPTTKITAIRQYIILFMLTSFYNMFEVTFPWEFSIGGRELRDLAQRPHVERGDPKGKISKLL